MALDNVRTRLGLLHDVRGSFRAGLRYGVFRVRIEVLGAAPDGESAWREVQRLKPDVLVTDIEMPGLSGLELAQRIQRHELPTKVVIGTSLFQIIFVTGFTTVVHAVNSHTVDMMLALLLIGSLYLA